MQPMWVLIAVLLGVSVTPSSAFSESDEVKKDQEAEFKIIDFKGQCIKDLTKETIAAGDFANVSFGPTVAAKVLTYDMSSKRVGFNSGVGAGFSMRLYNDVKFYTGQGGKLDVESSHGIKEIRKK